MSFGYRGRGGPQFGFNPRMRGRGGPGQGFGGPGPRGPGGPRPRWGGAFAAMNNMNAVPPPGHPMARAQHPMQQQWQAMGWNGNGGGGDFQNDWEGPGPDGNFQEDGGGPVNMNLVSPNMVKEWLARQHPDLVKDIQQHTEFLLDKMGAGGEGGPPPQGAGPQQGGPGGDFASDEPSNASWFAPVKPNTNQGPPAKKQKGRPHPGLGFSGNARGGQIPSSQMQWTPEGWVAKDNSHKVTTMMRPLPKLQIVPPLSTTYPDASMDSDKLKMLENNVNMMTAELNKICRLFKIKELNRDDLSQYPEGQQEKLKTALTCVGNAEKTVENYKDFLKTEKYKEWNEQQNKKQEDHVKEMIGSTPGGVPHKKPERAEGEEDDENGEGVPLSEAIKNEEEKGPWAFMEKSS